MTVTEDTTERPATRPATERSSGPGTTTQAMKDAVKRPTAFEGFADWVSEAMGGRSTSPFGSSWSSPGR